MKRFNFGMFAAVALAAAVVVSAPVAFAQTAAPTPAAGVIDFRPLLNEVVLPLGTAAAVWFAGWLTTRITGWLKISRDDRVRAYLEKALLLAIDYGRSKLDRGSPITMQVKSQIVADAANYAVEHVPGALKHFGVDQDALKRMLAARLEATTPAELPKG